jgi:hypothetical protein
MTVFELRLYDVNPGRMPALISRMGKTIPPLFERNGIPKPSGEWIAIGGPRLPAYLYLLRWENFRSRADAFARQYADSERPSTRNEFGVEITSRIYLTFLERIARNTQAADRRPLIGVHELLIYRPSRENWNRAKDAVFGSYAGGLERVGGRIIAAFQTVAGGDSSTMLVFRAWENEQTRRKALRHELDPRQFGQIAQQWLLKPLDYGLPVIDFGE